MPSPIGHALAACAVYPGVLSLPLGEREMSRNPGGRLPLREKRRTRGYDL